MPLEITPPFHVFTDVDGEPLTDGFIHIGAANQNPQTVPISVFWDQARTIPAAQPIRTTGGYPSRSGTPSRMYVAENAYSISVTSKNGVLVYSDLNNLAGDLALRDDLADSSNPSKGAGQIGWRGDTAGEFLDGGWFQPNDLDVTGVTDESASVLAYLVAHKRVRLPEGIIRIDSLSIPSDASLCGSGELTWNSGTGVWDGVGTLVYGRINLGNKQRVTLSLMSIDNYDAVGNPVVAQGNSTRYLYLARVNTRANNHGMLFEQNGSDPAGASGGDIVIDDCLHFGGPNGYAIKMRNVTISRCRSSGGNRGFVIVSDNINGAGTYSRASNVTMIDCGGSGNQTTFLVYTRDEHSLTNANGVLPATDIKWIRGDLSGCTEHGARIGDFFQAVPTRTQINSENIRITGARAILNLMRGVTITLGTRVTVDNCIFGNNGGGNNISFDSFGSRVIGLDVARGHRIFGGAVGAESGVFTLDVGATSINASHGANIYRTANVATTTITTIAGGTGGQILTLSIDDDFTTCIVGGKAVKGKGTTARYIFDSVLSDWVVADGPMSFEGTTGWAASLTLDYSNPGVTSRFVSLNSTTTIVNLTAPALSMAGRIYTLRLTPTDGANKAITAWSSSYKFSTGVPAPTVVNGGTSTVLQFYWSGTHMVAISSVNYTN